MRRAFFALLTSLFVASTLGESPEPAKVRVTTWNLEWFPNRSAHDATPELEAQRIAAGTDVLRPINPDFTSEDNFLRQTTLTLTSKHMVRSLTALIVVWAAVCDVRTLSLLLNFRTLFGQLGLGLHLIFIRDAALTGL